MTFIYALADPETDEIRYVGKADSVKERFTSHMREAKQGKHCFVKAHFSKIIMVLYTNFKCLGFVHSRF